jgi:hypothetical protein
MESLLKYTFLRFVVLTFKLSAGRGFYEYDNHADEVIWDFDPL